MSKFKPDYLADGILLAGEYAIRGVNNLTYVAVRNARGCRFKPAGSRTDVWCSCMCGGLACTKASATSSCYTLRRHDLTSIIWRPYEAI